MLDYLKGNHAIAVLALMLSACASRNSLPAGDFWTKDVNRDPTVAVNTHTHRTTVIRAAKLLGLETSMPRTGERGFELIIGAEPGQYYLQAHTRDGSLYISHKAAHTGLESTPIRDIKVVQKLQKEPTKLQKYFEKIMLWEPIRGKGGGHAVHDAPALFFRTRTGDLERGVYCISDPFSLDVKNIKKLLNATEAFAEAVVETKNPGRGEGKTR